MNIITYLRHFRIGPFAVFDFSATIIAALLLSPLLSWLFLKIGVKIPLRSWVLWSIPFAEAVHFIIGKQTALLKLLADPHGHYVAKIVILALFVLGFWGVKLVKK